MINITQIQVFVSCPSDVTVEKQIVNDICNQLNRILLQSGCSIQLIVRDWSEVLGQVGIQPQDSINATFKEYDIYVGILWMKFGTPTKNFNSRTGEPFQSGTEEEFENAYEKWKLDSTSVRINFFFKDTVPVNTSGEIAQLSKVFEFRDRLRQIGMTNSFTDKYEFKDKIYHLLTQITLKLCISKKFEIKNDLVLSELKTSTVQISKDELNIIKNNSLKNIEHISHYIPRYVTSIKEFNEKNSLLFRNNEFNTLLDASLKSSRIVLLGNAGTGKSIELQQLALSFSSLEMPFIPIYKRFNTYVDEDIENYLPLGWNDINHEIVLLLFDGLDEIQPKYFNVAIRKIANFSERFPDIRIIVSCRTNFYDLPTDTFSGTLSGFDCFYLNDLSLDEIKTYATVNFKIAGEKFVNDTYTQEYLDLIVKPFFLNILISHYKQFGDLQLKRAEIMKEFVLSRIKLDKEHFRTTIDKQKSKTEIIGLLQRVALAMEMMGRNFITSSELLMVVVNEDNINSLKYFSAFNKKNGTDESWSFEHNNIQEYLAASILVGSSFETIKQIISFPPTFIKIKPSWVNTLSFLISISNEADISVLIDWLVKTDPEIVIKFERDRISKELRLSTLTRIFEFYKEKGIWLRSNKFTDSELAKFSQSDQVIEYLLNELSDLNNSRVIKLNAINIIEKFDFTLFSSQYIESLKKILFDLLEKENQDSSFVYAILGAMAELKLTTKEILEKILEKFGQRKNQYIRSGLYKIIGASDFVDDYIDTFLEGIDISNDDGVEGGREGFNLADESWLLKEGLLKAKSLKAITKILEYFNDPTGRRNLNFYERNEVFANLTKNAIKLFHSFPSIYDSFFSVFITSGKVYDLDYAKKIVQFFNQTKTTKRAFKDLWNYPDVSSYERGTLIALLADKDIVDYFVAEFLERNFTKDDVISLHKELIWHVQRLGKSLDIIVYLEEQVKEKVGFELEKQPQIDYIAINQRKSQENFDILFNTEDLLSEINQVFTTVGSDELNYDKLWEVRRNNNVASDSHFPDNVLAIVREFTHKESTVTFDVIRNWIMSKGFPSYQIREIYESLKNNVSIHVSESQLDFITKWSLSSASRIDWENIVRQKSSFDESFIINNDAKLLWYFVDKLNVPLSHEQLLGFTMFVEFGNNINDNSHIILDRLEQLVDLKDLHNKITVNLTQGIQVSWIWKSNALYAIDKNLKEVFPKILENLKDQSKSEFQRRDVLIAYFEKTRNFNSLREIIKGDRSQNIVSTIIELLLPYPTEREFLIEYLRQKIYSENETISDKLKAARYLTELNDIIGLSFYTEQLLADEDPNYDFHKLNFLSKLTSIEALPNLLKLLNKAMQPEILADNLQSAVLSGIHSIGSNSEENLLKVKKELILFISMHEGQIPNVNFLYFAIERMEDQFYLEKSKSVTVEDAVAQIKAGSFRFG